MEDGDGPIIPSPSGADEQVTAPALWFPDPDEAVIAPVPSISSAEGHLRIVRAVLKGGRVKPFKRPADSITLYAVHSFLKVHWGLKSVCARRKAYERAMRGPHGKALCDKVIHLSPVEDKRQSPRMEENGLALLLAVLELQARKPAVTKKDALADPVAETVDRSQPATGTTANDATRKRLAAKLARTANDTANDATRKRLAAKLARTRRKLNELARAQRELNELAMAQRELNESDSMLHERDTPQDSLNQS